MLNKTKSTPASEYASTRQKQTTNNASFISVSGKMKQYNKCLRSGLQNKKINEVKRKNNPQNSSVSAAVAAMAARAAANLIKFRSHMTMVAVVATAVAPAQRRRRLR